MAVGDVSKERLTHELDALEMIGRSFIAGKLSPDKKSSALLASPKCDSISYQSWYSRSLALLRQALPFRVAEFEALYNPKRTKLDGMDSYGIFHWLQSITLTDYFSKPAFDHGGRAVTLIHQQVAILSSAKTSISGIVDNLVAKVGSEVLDSEIASARALLKVGHLRAAGAIAGVVLESHLSAVGINHGIKLRKATPTLADYNDALKDAEVFELPTWRFVQHLADIRNLCVHQKDLEPTREHLKDLIDGVEKITRTTA
jgi:hypothetical protein